MVNEERRVREVSGNGRLCKVIGVEEGDGSGGQVGDLRKKEWRGSREVRGNKKR